MAYIYGSPLTRTQGLQLVNTRRAAELLHVSTSFLEKDRLRANSVVPCVRLPNGRVMYDMAELNQIIKTWHQRTSAMT